MDDSAPAYRRLDALRPAIKRRWEVLLRAEPPSSALASPDTFVFLMDTTLERVASALHTGALSPRAGPGEGSLQAAKDRCKCGLNPLLTYYISGEKALIEIAGPVLRHDLDCALIFFHGLAHREIEALCGVCNHCGTEHCRSTPARYATRNRPADRAPRRESDR
jgi:hypothetical protein